MSSSPARSLSPCASMSFPTDAYAENAEKMPIVSPTRPSSQSSQFSRFAPPASTTHPQPAVYVTRIHFFLIMLTLWIGNFTAYFNETSVTTAMHAIGAEFNDLANQNWIATSYLLGFTVTQTLLGKFSDIFGRAKVFNATMMIFAVATLWCGMAQSMNSLIGARLLQGIGAAGRQSIGIIIILDLTTPDTRGIWLGFFNLASAIGLAIGPVLGAVLSIDANWRWIYWITLMLIAVTFVIGACSLRYPVPHHKQRVGILAQLRAVDYVGSILSVAISSMICIAIEMGNKMFPWKSFPIIILFILGGLLIPVFIWYELKVAEEPIVDIRLFSIPNIPIGCLINFLTGAGYFGSVFFLPRYFIDIKGSGLVDSGLQMFGLSLSLGLASVLGAHILSQSGQVRLVGVVGGVLYALGSGLMILVGRYTPSAKVIGFSVITGFGSGMLYQPSLVVGPMSVEPNQIAGISGFLSFLRTLGGTFATALLTAIFETKFTNELRGKLPDSLVNQGLGLADNRAQYPQYNNEILNALVKGHHAGTVPAIVFGFIYAVAVLFLRNVDFVPRWRQRQLERRQQCEKT